MNRRNRSVFFIAFILLLVPRVMAQTSQPSGQYLQNSSVSISETKPDFSVFNASVGGSWVGRSSLEGGGGFSETSVSADVGIQFPLVSKLLFGSVGFSSAATTFDFSGGTSIGGSDRPWGQVNQEQISAGLLYKIDDRWATFALFDVSSAGQTGADFGQTVTYGGVVGAAYKFSDRLNVGVALIAQSRLEQSVKVLPFPTFNWLLPIDHDRWRVYIGGTGPNSVSDGGAGGGVSYTPIKPLTISAGLGGLGLVNNFRLNSRSSISNGVVESGSSRFILAVNYRPIRNLSVSGFVGASLPGQLKVLSSERNAVYTEDYGVAPVAGMSLKFRF